ncbi:MAG: electron transfer flavoprotein subunit beta/FixA family protein [Eubacteriales bacterium]
MNILVCLKQVPDTDRVAVDPVTGSLKREGAGTKMNPYDLYALEAALQLRAQCGGRVSVLTMGPPQAAEVIREAYAMGADEGMLLTDRAFAGADVLATAYTLSQGVALAGDYDLILCGKQTTDGDTAQVGPEMSEFLGLPCVAQVSRIVPDPSGGTLTLSADMGDRVLTLRVQTPCLLCVDGGANVPRLPSYLKKKATADKPIRTLGKADLPDQSEQVYGSAGSPTGVRRIFTPEHHTEHRLHEGGSAALAQLVADKLTEWKVL